MEVTTQTGVVLLNDDPGGLLDGLGSDASLKTKPNHTTAEICSYKKKSTNHQDIEVRRQITLFCPADALNWIVC